MGTVGIVAQAHGSKEYDEIVNLVFRNIAFVILISLLLILCQKYIFTISLSIFELSDDTTKYFKEYFDLRIYSSFGELTIYIITGLFIGLQRTTL
jgi:MATE family multidrug resistance protein